MPPIQFDEKSETVQIHLVDGRTLTGLRGAAIGDFLRPLHAEHEQAPIVGAIINQELRELTFPVTMESLVEPVTMAMEDGMRIYRRSLTFLLETAFHLVYPGEHMTIDHSVVSGGYFCQVEGRGTFTQQELKVVEDKMRALVKRDLPFARKQVPLSEAIALFEKWGFTDKVRLLKHRKKDFLVLYELDDYLDYHHGYMLPSTGGLRWFNLDPIEGGFTVRFPRRHRPTEMLEPIEQPKILAAFREYGRLLNLLDISSVGALNDSIIEGRVREVILVSEALHEQRAAEVAAQIVHGEKAAKVVLLAGPSSSGKTTFAKRLAVQLLAFGVSPFALELDRFFVDRDKTPVDERGEFDFEHLDAVDRPRLNHDMRKLIAGERVRLPHYNFLTGKSDEGAEMQLLPGQVVIIEGIHGLNPDLLPEIPEDKTFRIYLSALTQLNLDSHNRVSTTDTRLVRRIVRDARERGYGPAETIRRWESVRRGEKRFIFPYQGHADAIFNSALVYELAALRPLAEPLLRQVPFGTREHIEVKRLLALLEWFLPLDPDLIPDNSLLREFIGGSILSDFAVWRNGH
jgi:uridine kinase